MRCGVPYFVLPPPSSQCSLSLCWISSFILSPFFLHCTVLSFSLCGAVFVVGGEVRWCVQHCYRIVLCCCVVCGEGGGVVCVMNSGVCCGGVCCLIADDYIHLLSSLLFFVFSVTALLV